VLALVSEGEKYLFNDFLAKNGKLRYVESIYRGKKCLLKGMFDKKKL
jgi:hypothetical protein